MTHTDNDHGGAIVHSLLGQKPAIPGEQYVSRSDHPGLGRSCIKVLGPSGAILLWVVLPRYFGTNSPPYKGQSAGFWGRARSAGIRQGEARIVERCNAEAGGTRFSGGAQCRAVLPPEGVDGCCNGHGPRTRCPAGGCHGSPVHFDQAFELLTSEWVRRTFDLEREPAAVRDRYGWNEYGQSFLMGATAGGGGGAIRERVLDVLRQAGVPVQFVGQSRFGVGCVRTTSQLTGREQLAVRN